MSNLDLKPLVDETIELCEACNNKISAADELQSKVHNLFESMALSVDRVALYKNEESPEYLNILADLRRHTFIKSDGDLDVIIERAKALGWPPVLPRVALIINLAAKILSCGVIVDRHYDQVATTFKFTEDDIKRSDGWGRSLNGWFAFYLVFENAIRDA